MPAPKDHSLAQVSLFRDLAPEARAAIERRCAWKIFAAKETIVHYEDKTRDVCFLVAGRARVVIYSAGGRTVAFRDIAPGQFFGEFSAIDAEPRSASVEALGPCVVAQLHAPDFLDVLAKHPQAGMALLRHAIAQVRSLTRRVVEFSTLAVNNRIQAELLRLALEQPLAAGKGRIAPAPTHAEIASRISTNREAVTRELNRLAEQGVIERPDAHTILCDVAELKRLVDEASDE